MDDYRYLGLENGRWIQCPETIRPFLRCFGLWKGYGDSELLVYAFPRSKFSNMDGFQNYLQEQRETDGNLKYLQREQQQFAERRNNNSRRVEDLLSNFLSIDLHYICIGDQTLHWDDRDKPWVLYQREEFKKTLKTHDPACVETQSNAIEKAYQETGGVVALFKGMEDPYGIILPSGELEFQEMRALRWDGNIRFVMTRDSSYWYYFRFITS